MQIAKIINGQVAQIEHYLVMYPLLTFPLSGPTPAQMQELSCMHVNMWKAHDHDTETLESCSPYIEGDWVYTVQVRNLTEEELAARADAKKQVNKSTAAQLLTASDFYDLPNTANKISNIDEITAYRDALRAIALNPPEVVDAWPIKPKTEWVV